MNKWEKFYSNTPLDKIPWHKLKADYLIEIIEKEKVRSGLTLVLGCGTGVNSIYLTKKGFNVTGIDISETAIRHAKENAKKENVNVNFIVADATDLSFLKDKEFDFILDWANLHGIDEEKRDQYINQIVEHCKTGGKFVLRCFSKYELDKDFVESTVTGDKVSLFSRQDIDRLFGKYFKILETNRSELLIPGEHPNKWFDEYLMEKI